MAESDDSDIWILGVVLVLLGSIGQNLGNNLMSLGHEQQRQIDQQQSMKVTKDEMGKSAASVYAVDAESCENKSADSHGDGKAKATTDNNNTTTTDAEGLAMTKKKEGESEDNEEEKGTVWFIGTVMFFFGSMSTFAAFGFAAASLLAALESIQFVTNIVFAKTVHNETITMSMILATSAIVLGIVLVVVFSSHSAKILDSNDVVRLYTLTPFHVYLGFFVVSFAITEFTYRHYYNARAKGIVLWKHAVVEPTAYCAASALVGAFAVINAKCLSMFIQVSSQTDRNEFALAPLYIILVTWIIFVAFWLRRLDLGFELYPPLFVIPMVQCLFIFFSIICGGIFFEEFNEFTPSQIGGFSAGVVCCVGGVCILALGVAPSTDMKPTLGQVVPVSDDDNRGTAITTNELDNSKKEVGLLKPFSEKEAAMTPGGGTQQADPLDKIVNSTPSSKRKIIKRDVED
jgi:hypothetical protein